MEKAQNEIKRQIALAHSKYVHYNLKYFEVPTNSEEQDKYLNFMTQTRQEIETMIEMLVAVTRVIEGWDK